MEDMDIIELYWQRNEQAIEESNRKYGGLCGSVAYRVLGSMEDCEECVSDTWLKAWNAIPPAVPSCLKAFFGKITRNLALNRYRNMNTEKRTKNDTDDAIYELSECLASDTVPDAALDLKLLGKTIGDFVSTLSKRDQSIFIGRYFYAFSVNDISRRLGMDEKYVSNVLSRTRNKLKKFLEKEGSYL